VLDPETACNIAIRQSVGHTDDHLMHNPFAPSTLLTVTYTVLKD